MTYEEALANKLMATEDKKKEEEKVERLKQRERKKNEKEQQKVTRRRKARMEMLVRKAMQTKDNWQLEMLRKR